MKAGDIIAAIEEFAPLGYQESWDNSGLCIGSPDMEVGSLLIGLDCTLSLIQEAVAIGADMVVTHHPMIFSGIKKISPDNNIGMAIITAIKNNIVVYSAHTNIDKVADGVSGLMARKLSLVNVEVLEQDSDSPEGVGLGIVGDLVSPMAPQSFIAMVKEAFGLKSVRCSEEPSHAISKVAMCGGSGKSLIKAAIAAGADVYLCGDLPYQEFFCEKDFMIMDVGHYESEINIVKTFYSIVKEKFPTFAVQIAERSNNPVHYY